MNRVPLLARATAAELLRRHVLVVAMVLTPLAFYVARHDLTGQSIRFVAIGMSWGLSTLAAFAGVAGRSLDSRLLLTGWRRTELFAGRLAGLLAVSLPLVATYTAVVLLDRDLDRPAGVVGMMLLTVLVALPLGLLLGALLGRPLEVAVVLLVVCGMQMLSDPADSWAPALPFWSVRQLGTWTVDGTGNGDLHSGLLHAAVTVVALSAATVVVRGAALRRRRHLVWLREPTGRA